MFFITLKYYLIFYGEKLLNNIFYEFIYEFILIKQDFGKITKIKCEYI